MIVGLIRSDQGSIGLNDQDLTRLPMHARAQQGVGYLPQEASVFRGLTVEENVLAVLQLRKDIEKKTRKTICEGLLQDLQITHIRNSKGFSLSGGERRRVEIARALAIQPRFILLDETVCRRRSNIGNGHTAVTQTTQRTRHWPVDYRS